MSKSPSSDVISSGKKMHLHACVTLFTDLFTVRFYYLANVLNCQTKIIIR